MNKNKPNVALWKIYKKVINSDSNTNIKLRDNKGKLIESDYEVAEYFNQEFIEKINKLRRPLTTPSIEIQNNSTNTFNLKPVTEHLVLKQLKKLPD